LPHERQSFFDVLELLLESTDETDNAVHCEEDTCNDEHYAGQTTKCDTYTCNDGEDREEKTENGGVVLDGVDECHNTLEGDENTKNNEDPLKDEPFKNDNSNTDSDADYASNPILLNEFENTGNDEEYTDSEKSPLHKITGHNCQKDTGYDVEDRGKQCGINFLFHNISPFFDIFTNNIIAYDSKFVNISCTNQS